MRIKFEVLDAIVELSNLLDINYADVEFKEKPYKMTLIDKVKYGEEEFIIIGEVERLSDVKRRKSFNIGINEKGSILFIFEWEEDIIAYRPRRNCFIKEWYKQLKEKIEKEYDIDL